MKAGDAITDTLGQTWTVDTALGRGAWGRVWAIRGPGGSAAVLKLPLAAADFGDRPDADELAALAAGVCTRTAALLAARPSPCLARPLAAPVDRSGMILPRLGGDLESRLQGASSLSEVLDLCVRTLHQLAHGSAEPFLHGNLRPTNVMVDEHGAIVLTDPCPPGQEEALARLGALAPGRVDYLPPGPVSAATRPGVDPWALCQVLFRACMSPTTSDDPRRGTHVPLPRAGLSRVALATVKDGAAARLKNEGANRRFAARVVERLGAVLNRGLSAETDPSPPYRFRRAADLLPRLVEVHDLVHPAVETVSKPLLAHAAREGVFDAGQDVELAVNVGTTAGVTAQDDLAVGVQLRDLDAPGDGRVRVPNARFTVKQYPSGRWRFSFVLPDITPGRYLVRIAFMVKGAEEHAQVSEGPFQVRPTPGYVPPPAPVDDLRPALSLSGRSPDAAGPAPGDGPASPAEVIPFPGRAASANARGAEPERALPIRPDGTPADAPATFSTAGSTADASAPIQPLHAGFADAPALPPRPGAAAAPPAPSWPGARTSGFDDRPRLAAVSAVTADDDELPHGPPTFPPIEPPAPAASGWSTADPWPTRADLASTYGPGATGLEHKGAPAALYSGTPPGLPVAPQPGMPVAPQPGLPVAPPLGSPSGQAAASMTVHGMAPVASEPLPRPAAPLPVDDGLQDYPGIPGGIDLPTYDTSEPPPSGARAALDRLVALFGGDGLTATVFLSSGAFIGLVLIVFLLRQC